MTCMDSSKLSKSYLLSKKILLSQTIIQVFFRALTLWCVSHFVDKTIKYVLNNKKNSNKIENK